MVSYDEEFMRHALVLAARGRGLTRPNPPVGALLVKRNKIVGKGWHRRAGGIHAEVAAIRQAGKDAVRATLYVTLEPCCTSGRTGACTDLIIRSGIKRVVYGVRDPNPAHRGKGIKVLRNAGLEVVKGPCAAESKKMIEPFAMTMNQGRAWLTLKMAVSLDGRIADASGASRWITGAQARSLVKRWRRTADAVMVGAGTVLADDPQLIVSHRRPLYRLIVDRDGVLHSGFRVFKDDFTDMTRVVTFEDISTAGLLDLEKRGIEVWRIPRKKNPSIFLRNVLKLFWRSTGGLHILCEGGGQLAAGLVRAGLVDELQLFVSGKVLGANGVPVVGSVDEWSILHHPRFEWVDVAKIGSDVLLTGRPCLN